MDLDLDVFERKDRYRGRRRRRDDVDDDGPWRASRDDDDDRGARRDRDDDDDRDEGWRRAMRRGRRHAPRPFRADHRHMFAWLVLGGGVVVLGLFVIGLMSALGLWGHVADAYFAASTAVLPASWHDEWRALPDAAHVGLGLAALFVIAGVAGEVLD